MSRVRAFWRLLAAAIGLIVLNFALLRATNRLNYWASEAIEDDDLTTAAVLIAHSYAVIAAHQVFLWFTVAVTLCLVVVGWPMGRKGFRASPHQDDLESIRHAVERITVTANEAGDIKTERD